MKAFRVTLQLGDSPMARQFVVTGDPKDSGIKVGDTCTFQGHKWRVSLIEETEVLVTIPFGPSAPPAMIECPICKGSGAEFPGAFLTEKCEECNGRGRVPKPTTSAAPAAGRGSNKKKKKES